MASPSTPSTALVPITTTPVAAVTATRRFPPPCWSPEETAALIDAYREKWYSLNRGNLKAPHWQEVADEVAARCPDAVPGKTALQCRHKMEKLRKRYRTEMERARSVPVSRFKSGWVHFRRMDEMEKGVKVDDEENDDDDDENDEDQFGNNNLNMRSVHKLYGNGNGIGIVGGSSSGVGSGFRIRIPTGVSVAQPGLRGYDERNDNQSRFNVAPPPYGRVVGEMFGKRERDGERKVEEEGKRKERDGVEEMVGAIKMLGDGFMRVEKMKMEMAKEIETMRMEMEMKRTKMILESQQRIVEAFANAVGEKKAKKANVIPSSP